MTVETPTSEVVDPQTKMEQELDAIMKTGENQSPSDGTTAPKAAPSKSSAQDPAPSPDPAEASQAEVDPNAEPDLETQLAEIEKEQPNEPEQPKLTADQEQILRVIPDVATAKEMWDQANGFRELTTAFISGKFDSVLEMLSSLDKEKFSELEEHLYQERLVKSDEWIKRWIEEHDNPASREVRSVRKEIAQLKGQLDSEKQSKQNQLEQARREELARNYTKHVDALFDRLKTPAQDRKFIVAAMNSAVLADPEGVKALQAGQFGRLNRHFATAVREFNGRDKATTEQVQTKLAEQEVKKAPLTAGNIVEGSVPERIDDVPKDQRDNWMSMKLAKLFNAKKS